MAHLEAVLEKLGMLDYLGKLLDAGFDTWTVVKDITEMDMQELDFKLGHRRKLQREIATSRGWPQNSPLEPTIVCSGWDPRRMPVKHPQSVQPIILTFMYGQERKTITTVRRINLATRGPHEIDEGRCDRLDTVLFAPQTAPHDENGGFPWGMTF